MKAFDRLLLLEIGGGVAGAYAAKLFADHGARVVKVEAPGGDPLRRSGDGSLSTYLDTSKESLEIDPASGRAELEPWLASADVAIESAAPDPLAPVTRGVDAPRLIRTWISPFGLTGPYRSHRSNEFTDDAIGGHLYLNGEPHREPITRPGRHSQYQAGVHAFVGTLAALRARAVTGRGQIVEVSHLEGMASMHQHTSVMWTHGGHVLRREGNRQPGMWHPVGVYPCKDGFVALALAANAQVLTFLAAAGLADLAGDPRFSTDVARGRHKEEFDAAIRPWLMDHDAAEIVQLGREVFTPVGPVPTLLEVLNDEHLSERAFWTRVGEAGLAHPRAPFRISGREPVLRPPPRIGEHGPIEPVDGFEPLEPDRPGRRAQPADDRQALRSGPLDGIRVLDLTRVWAGPLAGRILADLGADVIAVEAPWVRGPRTWPPEAAQVLHLFPDNEVGERPWNRIGGFNKLARNKRAVTLRLDREEGRALFERLVQRADVVLENYSPRVMPQLGLAPEHLLELNPHLVYVSMPGFGLTGPNRDGVAFGPLIESGSGLSSLMGYPDSGPYRSGIAWADPVSGINAVAATLLALWDRDADPERAGRVVEVPMIEAMTTFLGDQLLAAQLRGSDPPRRANRHPERAPQGCYPCAGEDRWIAISVETREEWSSLCALASLDGAFAAMDREARLAHHDAIDRALSEWTRQHASGELMALLQSRGVIACRVSDARDLVEDPQLEARGFWVEHAHRDAGRHPFPGLPIRLSDTPATYRRPAPRLGEHNAEVLGVLLGLDAGEIAALEVRGVLVDTPPA